MQTKVSLNKKGNTKVYIDGVSELQGTDTVIKLYDTEVVRFNDSRIILNTGGWKTVTTKQRMNQASLDYHLMFGVHQMKGQWFVSYDSVEIPFPNDVLILQRI